MTHDPYDAACGIIIVDHGSRQERSNAAFLEFVRLFRKRTGHAIVEAAHMDLAEPTLAQAFDRCVERGARRVVVFPYFLLPGRHWEHDIPAITGVAAARHPEVEYLVTAPIGLHAKLVDIIDERIRHCGMCSAGDGEACDLCTSYGGCSFRGRSED